MKKKSSSFHFGLLRITILSLMFFLICVNVNAQILAKWPLTKNKPVPPLGVWGPSSFAVGVNAPVVVPNDSFNIIFGTPTPGTTGLRLKQSHNWPSGPTPLDLHYAIDFPISPAAGNDLLITGLSLEDSVPTSSGGTVPTISVIPYYQIDGKGNWTPLATAQSFPMTASTNVNFGTINVPFFYNSSKATGHTYAVRLYFYSTDGAVKGDYFNLTNVTFYGTVQTATTTPTVKTISAAASPTNGKYAGIVTGSYDFGAAYQNPTMAGVVWGTNANPDIVSSFFTNNGTNGTINSTITGLSANTTYHVRAYIVTPIDTLYGQDLTFTTDNYTAPVDSTVAATNVTSIKATVGGIILDSGGTTITNKIIKYGTNKAALTNIIKPINNTGSAPYTVTLTQLLPNTKYYYEACATNSINTSCGSIDSFTTSGVVPTLSVKPPLIDFGNIIYNSNATISSYTLTGANLNPSSGTVTINISPASGFVLSTSSNTFPASPVSSISIPYSGGSLKKTVYVKFLTNTYGKFSSVVGHSGGGVAPQDADSVYITGTIIPSPDKLSNMGTDFWTGFGCEEAMNANTTQFDTVAGVAKGAHFSLYIATGNQPAQVLVELPGLPGAVSFPQNVTIQPNSVVQIGGFPVGDGNYNNPTHAPDSRLYYTGVSSRGIHVTSTNGVPIACWLYDWATNRSAAGAMLFPSNTWNSSYSVQAYGGTTSNTGVVSSYFFAIANDDNTVLSITPTADIIDSASSYIANKTKGGGTILHPKGTTYYVTLPHKGDVYNAIGLVDANTGVGYDLTGTVVSTDCNKKIAVFGGNSRTLINTTACNNNTSGSDNLVQQMFPKVAWGTKYLTVPTKNMEFNTYRVSVEDTATVVKVNGSPILPSKYPVLGATWNAAASFYEFASNQPMSITADQPISVTQFIMPGGSCGGASVGNDGTGDPEMILLSPIQQAINNATVFCPGFKDASAGGTYINVIIPSSGVGSFSIDGKTLASIVDTGSSSYGTAYGTSNTTLSKAFVTHKGDTSYRYATFHVAYPAPHTISSTVPFNAIAYGESQGESWGFNAGTAINNLSSVKIADNPNGKDTSSSVVLTCKDNPVRLEIALPYLPSQVDSIVWSAPNNSNINLSGTDITGPYKVVASNPTKVQADTSGTIVVNGETFYLYTCPVVYQFSDYGFYPMVATAYGKFASDCAGIDAQTIYVQVGTDNIDFKVVKAGCTSPNVTITDSTTAFAGTSIVKWIWDLGDKSPIQTYTDPVNHNPTPNPYTYPALSAYTIKLTTVNSIGCNSTDTFPINLSFGINAGFTKDNDTICSNGTVTFTDTSSSTADKWVWDFGEPSSGANNTATFTSTTNPSHTYTTPGKHVITLQVFSGVCPSNVFKDSVFVSPNPVANFTHLGVCLPGSTVFTNTSDTATGFVPYSYQWFFGDSTNNIPNTSTATNGIHIYQAPPTNPNGYDVVLIATNKFGCIGTNSQNVKEVYAKPTADFTVVKSDVCSGSAASFADNGNSTVVNQTITKWNWSFGDGHDTTTTANGSSHIYGSLGTYNVKLVVQTDKGCLSDSSIAHTVTLHPLPVSSFVLPGSCLGSGSVTFTNTSTISSGEPLSSVWSFNDPNNPPNSSTATDGVHNFKDTGTYSIVLTSTSTFGCSTSATESFNVAGSQPIPSFTVANPNSLCSNSQVTITDVSSIAVGIIKKVEIYWNYTVGSATPDTTDNNPSKGLAGNSKSYMHNYPVSTTDQTYNIKLVAYSGTTCFHDTIVSITVHGSPVVTFTASPVSICANATPATITGATETAGPTGTPGFTYVGPGVTNGQFDPSKAAVGSNSIQAIYTTANSCTASALSTINVLPIFTVSFNISPDTLNICKTDSITLSPVSNAPNYYWSESDSLINNTILTSNTTKLINVKPKADVTVYYVVADPSNCPSRDSITIYASPYPNLSIVSPINLNSNNLHDTTICFNGSATLTANTTNGASIVWTSTNYLFNSTSLSAVDMPLDTTMYIAKATGSLYCGKSVYDTAIVNVLPKFSVGVRIGNDTSAYVVPNEPFQLNAYIVDTSLHTPVAYTWSPTTYLDNSDTSSPILTAPMPFGGPNDSLIYYVTATTKNAQKCAADTSFKVRFFNEPDILVPTAFTPNGDGKNDILLPVPVGITHFGYFSVFNRLGQLIYHTTKLYQGWDGTFNGAQADPGTYIYVTEGTDFNNKPHFHQGTVVLIR